MKCYLFIDNFRGFANTYIPISNVNFFVGENSTGKTSVLALLKLLSGPRFFFQTELADQEVSLGPFSDMVSAHSEDKTFFRVGVVLQRESEQKKEQGVGMGWLCTFLQQEGMPVLFSYTLCRGSEMLFLRFEGNHVHFRKETYPTSHSADEILKTLLPQWIDEHCGTSGTYDTITLPAEFPGRLPLMAAMSVITQSPFREENATKHDAPAVPLLNVVMLPEVIWIAPIRTKPRRTYDEPSLSFSPEGGHTPYVIRKMLGSKAEAKKFHAFMKHVGKASGLFQDVRIKNFGKGATAPFEVDVVLDGKGLSLSTVGYGVSQSLPVLVEILARGPGTWLAIQQPEVHLHPRAQAALGEVLFEMAARYSQVFLVETHSDFTIDRFRMNYRTERADKPEGQVLFFERREKHNVVTSLPISASGDFPTDQPQRYRDFFVKEEMRLLGI
jgi:hypothetical protein